MDKPRTRSKTKVTIVAIILAIFIILIFELSNVFSAGDPPFNKQKDVMQVDVFSATEEGTPPEIDDTQVKIKLEKPKNKTTEEPKEEMSSGIVEDSMSSTNIDTETNNKNVSDIIDEATTEEATEGESPTDYESTDVTTGEETNTEEPPIDDSTTPKDDNVASGETNNENIENIPNGEITEETSEKLPTTNKFTPQGPYSSVDFSIYTPEEIEVLNIVLAKIKENKNSDKKEETIDINSKLSLESYYKVASYFYIYYGQKRAVDETFDLVNHTEHDMTTGESITTYMIRMRYEDIRNFEKELQKAKDKADEILSNFETGPDVFILYQISEYLRTHITYTEGKYDITSALIDGESVCNGYALAFNMLANRAGIKSDMCIGEVPNAGMHAWNRAVLEDGSYAFYDITFYDTNNPNTKYILSEEPLHTTNYLINDYTDCWFG